MYGNQLNVDGCRLNIGKRSLIGLEGQIYEKENPQIS